MTLSYICIILISVYIQNIILELRVVYVVSHSTDTDLTLTTERLMELFASMHDEYIDHLRLYLDTPSSKKEEFNMNYKDPARRKEAYLDYYVHNNPLASGLKLLKHFVGVNYPNKLLWWRTLTLKVCTHKLAVCHMTIIKLPFG